jgi:hypothetical protein
MEIISTLEAKENVAIMFSGFAPAQCGEAMPHRTVVILLNRGYASQDEAQPQSSLRVQRKGKASPHCAAA